MNPKDQQDIIESDIEEDDPDYVPDESEQSEESDNDPDADVVENIENRFDETKEQLINLYKSETRLYETLSKKVHCQELVNDALDSVIQIEPLVEIIIDYFGVKEDIDLIQNKINDVDNTKQLVISEFTKSLDEM
jgi:hypothetical protein